MEEQKHIEVKGTKYISIPIPFWAACYSYNERRNRVTFKDSRIIEGERQDIDLPSYRGIKYELIGTIKALSWDKRCEIRGIPNTYYDQSVIGNDGIEFDVTHYNKEADDWKGFLSRYGLYDNELLFKLV